MSALRVVLACAGGVWGLLVARLIFRLLAARPDNPVVAAVVWVTGPLRMPLAWMDSAQPTFGAVLEISTLTAIMIGGLGLIALRFWAVRQNA